MVSPAPDSIRVGKFFLIQLRVTTNLRIASAMVNSGVRGAFPNIGQRTMTAGRYEGATAENAVPFSRASSVVISFPIITLQGPEMVMNIDLDSWEVGYTDGHLGRPSQCAVNLDSCSYSTGYCVGRARHAGTDRGSIRRQARIEGPRLNLS